MNFIYGPFIAGRGAVALLLMRFVCGLGLAVHGWGKLQHGYGFHWGDGLQIAPGLQALATLGEFGGGLGLIVGLLTPLASFGVVCTMLYAIVTVHLKAGEPFVNPEGGPSWELNALYLIIPVALIVCGPGRLSLDRLLFDRERAGQRAVR